MAGRNLLNLEAQGGRNLLKGQDMSWAEVGQQAIKNIPESGQKFFKDIWQAVRHPVETGGTLYDVADGAIRLMAPGGDSPNEDKARMVGQFFADRYGSMEGFKRSVATDPVGMLGDFATVLTGGGGLAARAPGVAGQVARTASTVGKAIDPINVAGTVGKAIWKGAENVPGINLPIPGVRDVLATGLGTMTSTGPGPLLQGAEAGFKGGKHYEKFTEGARLPAALEGIVHQAKGALGLMKKAASDSYKSTMGRVAEYSKPLDFGPIDKAFREVADMGTYRGPTTGIAKEVTPSTQKIVGELAEIIDEWRMAPKEDFHTPMGLDALKQRVWDAGDGLEAGSNAALVRNKVYHAIKDHIVNNAPEYEKAMGDYHKAQNIIDDIQKSLRLGDKAATDSSIRALTSVMRNNVNTSYGFREALTKMLSEAGAPYLLDSIAGAAVSSPMPRGVQGAGTAATALAMGGAAAGDVLPWASLGLLPLTSPRLIGELYGAGGRAAGAIDGVMKSRLAQALAGPSKRLGANQAGRLEQALREKGMVK